MHSLHETQPAVKMGAQEVTLTDLALSCIRVDSRLLMRSSLPYARWSSDNYVGIKSERSIVHVHEHAVIANIVASLPRCNVLAVSLVDIAMTAFFFKRGTHSLCSTGLSYDLVSDACDSVISVSHFHLHFAIRIQASHPYELHNR